MVQAGEQGRRETMAHWIGKKEIKTVSDHPRDFQPDGKKCEFCDFFFEGTEIHKTIEDEDICSYCIEDHDFVQCEYCGIVFEKEVTMTCPKCGHHQIGEEE